MPTITASTGAIDVNGIVTQLMQIERQPLTKIAQSKTALQTKLSSVGKISSALSTFQDASRALLNAPTWKATTATSSDATSISVTSGGGAPVGNFSITVSNLAQNQSGSTAAFAQASTVIGGGTLRLQFGSSGGVAGQFTADPARAETAITIPDNATVTDVVTAINSANAGISASLVKDSSGTRIMLRSRESGANNAFKVTAEPAAASNLNALNFDPANAAGPMRLNQFAQDAHFALDGLDLASPTNRVDSVLEGMTLELRKVSASPVNISVTTDAASIRAGVDKFVSAYNDLNKALADATKYDSATKTAGTLQGDSSYVGLQSRIRQVLAQTIEGGDLKRLSDAGLSIQRDGSLAVDSTKFAAAAAAPERLQALFAANDPLNASRNGFARRFNDLVTGVLGVDGAISGSQDRIRRQMSTLDDKEARLNQRLIDIEKRLTQTYTALDVNLSKIKSNFGSIE